MARKNSKKAMDIDEISYEYEVVENEFGLEEEIIGTPVASFSFNSNSKENKLLEVSKHANSIGTNFNSKPNLTNPNIINSSNENESQTPIANDYTSLLNSRTTTVQNEFIDHRVGKPTPNGITPPIDGEPFDIRRTYPLRKSTIRKLNELKAAHPDVTVYLSTILDAAIVHYYNYIFLEGGSQK